MNESTLIFYWAGEELLRMRSLAERRRERIQVLEELLKFYRADYTASFKRCGELIKENAELNRQINEWHFTNGE